MYALICGVSLYYQSYYLTNHKIEISEKQKNFVIFNCVRIQKAFQSNKFIWQRALIMTNMACVSTFSNASVRSNIGSMLCQS